MNLNPLSKKGKSRDRVGSSGSLKLSSASASYVSTSHHRERDVTIDIDQKELIGDRANSRHKNRKRKKFPKAERYWNCGGWLPWINFLLITISLVLMLIFYLHWNGAGGETVLARMERGETNLLPKPKVVMEGMRELYHNHSRRIEFNLNVEPGQFVRYPKNGHIEGLDPNTIAEHRLCCHVNDNLFICDYGQGASRNMGIECVVEYNKKTNHAHLRIVIQSSEMKGARCAFGWSTLEPNELISPSLTAKEDEKQVEPKEDEEREEKSNIKAKSNEN